MLIARDHYIKTNFVIYKCFRNVKSQMLKRYYIIMKKKKFHSQEYMYTSFRIFNSNKYNKIYLHILLRIYIYIYIYIRIVRKLIRNFTRVSLVLNVYSAILYIYVSLSWKENCFLNNPIHKISLIFPYFVNVNFFLFLKIQE